MSLQMNPSVALRSEPNQWKNANSAFTVRFFPTHKSRLQWASIW